MKVRIVHGPSNNPRGQGTAERKGAWLQGILSELCNTCLDNWDEYYVMPACWVKSNWHVATLPSNMAPFRILYSRDPRTPLDTLLSSPDGEEMEEDLKGFANRQKQVFREMKRKHSLRRDMK